jgi:hypothetical protein
MATRATTVAHLTAVGMAGSDAQVSTLLSALGKSSDDNVSVLIPATHDDVAVFIATADTSFVRTTAANGLADKAELIALSSADELKLWRYRQLWSRVRPTDTDATLVSAGWLQTKAALAALES